MKRKTYSALLVVLYALLFSGGDVGADELLSKDPIEALAQRNNIDMKNFASQILGMQKTDPIQNPEWLRGTKILGWRFLDKNHQALGKVGDVFLNKDNGEFIWVKVDTDRLNFITFMAFDRLTHNIRIEDQVMFCDLDKKQIFKNAEIFKNSPVSQPDIISLADLLRAPVYLPSGLLIGNVTETLGPNKTTKVDYLVVMVHEDRKTVPIPLSQIILRIQDGMPILEITEDQYKIMREFTK
ncbi:MAG: hypothetical protein PHX61_11885 [Alphaproteobacteria bacterium]|nr:hypothetical protein [Alphaproteobacteria bacterium]